MNRKKKLKCRLVVDVSTIRRHLEKFHEGAYHAWTEQSGFVSMLPSDSAARCSEANRKDQTRLDPHLHERPPPPHVVKYSHGDFRKAAIDWLVEIDQPLQALEHPSFKNMIDIAARATDGVRIPNRKQTRAAIIDQFKDNLRRLREQLNVCFLSNLL
ncbi:hypothetical protein C8Q74DRAFT_1194947 [Fomes fomentarius]|nr:hypothetical protein C8Q74DRAFT_1194947 [Fomes fomentarius]